MPSVLARIPRLTRRSTVHLGLDLGERRTKLVGISRGPEGLSLVCWADEEAPGGLFTNGRLTAVEEAGRHVAEVFAARKIRGRRTALSVAQHDCSVRRLEVQRLAKDGVMKALRSNPALKVGDTAGNNLAVDFHEITARTPVRAEMMSVLGVAARRDSIRTQQRVVLEAGLMPGLVTVPSIALANAWSLAYPDRVVHDSRSLLVHAGQAGVLFVVLDGGVPAASHYASLGIDYFTETARAANAMLSPAALEEALYRESAGGLAEAAFRDWFGRIAQEARRTAGAAPLAGGIFGGDDLVGEIWVSGGAARVAQLRSALEGLLGARVHLFDPLAALRRPDDAGAGEVFGPALAIAVGLAAEAAMLDAEGAE